jgi:peptide/nickel transport system permease protein
MSRKAALWFLGFLLFLAVFRDVIANGRPLYCRIGGETYWPGLRAVWMDPSARFKSAALNALAEQSQYEAWKNFSNYDAPPIFAPIPFSPGEYSTRHLSGLFSPGASQPELNARFKHWLGTDSDGRDVAATLVSGARIALLTGSVAMAMALLIGLTLGTIAGYFGDERLKVRRGRLWMTFLGLLVAYFAAFVLRQYSLSVSESALDWWKSLGIFCFILLIFNLLGGLLSRLPFFSKALTLPADLIIMRFAEVFTALPKLIVVIALSVLMQRQNDSIWLLIALIGAMSWTSVARFVRAELLRIRELDYVTAARGLGLPNWRILFRHALPNALRPVLVVLAFGVGGAVLLEATLSFLGFGGEAFKGVSWGSLLARDNAQTNPLKAWWVMLPPGLFICFTILAFNALGDKVSAER